MEYYGYKPKDIDKSYIDWAGITKGISEEIRGVAKERQDKRNELEKEHFKQLQSLNEFEQGMDPSINNFVLKGAQENREYLMQINKQMKAGLISPDDVKIRQQNLSDGWSTFNSTMQTLNKRLEILSEAEGKGNDAVIEEVQRILNFGKNTLIPDPETGELFLVGKKEDGSIDSSTARPLRALSNIIGQKFDFVDVEAESKKIADDAGVWKQTFANGLTIEDARKNPDYSSWIFNVVKSKMNTDEKMASVLLDYDNQEYTTTGEEGKIQLEFDRSVGKMVPKLTDAQRKRAKHVFEHAIEAKIGAVRTEQQLTKDERAMKDLAGLAEDYITTGNKSSLDALLTGTGHVGAEQTANGLILKGIDGTRTAVNLKQGMDSKQLARELATKAGVTMYDRFGSKELSSVNESVFDPSMYTDIITQTPKETELDFKQMSTLDKDLESNLLKVLPGNIKAPKTGDELESALKENFQTMTGYLLQEGYNKVFEYKDGNIFYDGKDLGSASQNLTSLSLKIKGFQKQEGAPSQVTTIPAPR